MINLKRKIPTKVWIPLFAFILLLPIIIATITVVLHCQNTELPFWGDEHSVETGYFILFAITTYYLFYIVAPILVIYFLIWSIKFWRNKKNSE